MSTWHETAVWAAGGLAVGVSVVLVASAVFYLIFGRGEK